MPTTFKVKPATSERQRRRRTGALLLTIEDQIGDMIAVASIREQLWMFGFDRVRGL